MSESVEKAERRRWSERGYRSLFPDLAPELPCRYDLVCMFHYLEHTRGPRAELDAAGAMLEPGSHLLIEVPDPEALCARLMGRYWIPWLQPQHLELLSVSHVQAALEERGFTVVKVARVGHQLQLVGALMQLFNSLATPPRRPWLDPPSPLRRARRIVTLTLAAPIVAVALPLDLGVLSPLAVHVPGGTTAFRVLARRN